MGETAGPMLLGFDVLWVATILSGVAAFAVMVAVSVLTRASVPADVGRTMLRLHAPESIGLHEEPDRSALGSTARRSQRSGRRTSA